MKGIVPHLGDPLFSIALSSMRQCHQIRKIRMHVSTNDNMQPHCSICWFGLEHMDLERGSFPQDSQVMESDERFGHNAAWFSQHKLGRHTGGIQLIRRKKLTVILQPILLTIRFVCQRTWDFIQDTIISISLTWVFALWRSAIVVHLLYRFYIWSWTR